VVVAVNPFGSDSPAEIEMVRRVALEAGALEAVPATHWRDGGQGAAALAEAVMRAAGKAGEFRCLYPLDRPIQAKIETICREIYGADGVDYMPRAERQIETYTRLGFAGLPVCMAKTHLSLSTDPSLKGVPRGFRVPVQEVRASVGAGFLYALLGEMRTMPGLPTRPIFYDVDLDLETGRVIGLF
jgi:formyltetrahydrofolate synthetase